MTSVIHKSTEFSTTYLSGILPTLSGNTVNTKNTKKAQRENQS